MKLERRIETCIIRNATPGQVSEAITAYLQHWQPELPTSDKVPILLLSEFPSEYNVERMSILGEIDTIATLDGGTELIFESYGGEYEYSIRDAVLIMRWQSAWRSIIPWLEERGFKLGEASGTERTTDLPMPTKNIEDGAGNSQLVVFEILATRFDESELRTLCFELGEDYEDLPPEGKAGKARELIRYLERRNRIPELVETGKRLRPDISWPEVASDE